MLGSGIPDKGKVLTQLSAFWFEQTRDIVAEPSDHDRRRDSIRPALRPHAEMLGGRSMLVRKTNPVPIECVARGYLSGSGWKDYRATGTVCGIPLPAGLRESDRLPEPIFTPATKATSGHDINISEAEAGRHRRRRADRDAARADAGALRVRRRARRIARHHPRRHQVRVRPDGATGALMLIDEVMTPDSSRFWPQDQYQPGGPQPSFDKQFVRDYLEQIRWNKQPPVPSLPDDVVMRTREKYLEAFRRLDRPRGLADARCASSSNAWSTRW